MLQLLKKHQKLNEVLFMGALTLFCFALSLFRFFYTGSGIFFFLNWNLFLAFIPWALSTFVVLHPRFQNSPVRIIIILVVWLLFFPNAPYILTDLFHLKLRLGMPVWFDLVLILSFAWTGLMYGFLSLWDIERILSKSIPRRWITILSVFLLFLGSFGVYMGRYLRWNSWDIITEPMGILNEIGDILINPLAYPGPWGMTFLMGFFLNIIYWSFTLISKRTEHFAG